MAISVLDSLQNAKQSPGAPSALEDQLVHEDLFFGGRKAGRLAGHEHSFERITCESPLLKCSDLQQAPPLLGAHSWVTRITRVPKEKVIAVTPAIQNLDSCYSKNRWCQFRKQLTGVESSRILAI